MGIEHETCPARWVVGEAGAVAVPEPALVTKKRMLSGAFGAFCARAAENPSDRSAIEAKRDSVFIGDFMIDLSLGLVRGCTSLANPFSAPGVFDSTRLTTYVTASYPPIGGLHHQ